MGLESNAIAILFALIAANVLQFLIGWLRSSLLASERDEFEEQVKSVQTQLAESQRANLALQFQLDCFSQATRPLKPDQTFLQVFLRHCTRKRSFVWMYHLSQNRIEPLGPKRSQLPRLTLEEGAIRKISTMDESSLELSGQDFSVHSPNIDQFDRLIVLPLGGGQVLLFTEVPEITGDVPTDLGLLTEVCSFFQTRKQSPSQRLTSLNEDPDSLLELELAREMLELRTLADYEFSTTGEMLETFLGRLAVLTGFERASLYLLDEKSGDRELFSCGGQALSATATQDWLAAEVLVSVGHHVGLQEVLPMTPEMLSQHKIPFHSGLMTPACNGSEELGILLLTTREEFTPDPADLQLAHWASEFIVQTLVKTLDRALIEDQARRDSLTQLANRHAFDQEFSNIVQQSNYLEIACSLVLMDIDHFKQINDVHGHPAGDAALKQVAQRISEIVARLRVTDRPLLARYGGEEFVLLLPNITGTGAQRIAETIRQAVCATPVNYKATQLQITLSAGVATHPEHAQSAEELLSRADAALYHAKHNGRNRVEVAIAGQQHVPA